ncbi:hypothetical protein BJ138DRAFT_501425 [Hygrophoropsis aurantiaca]|uniref:Uncharacterized protein n=1 Tax=Hygrophoropsis aurantiaca TaxID=72124 RepID=A0ACB8A283_9AGAM|nr:hypothetical protein BJ138DRAFT_501425 [Hygrophoropsis aurantiaca]
MSPRSSPRGCSNKLEKIPVSRSKILVCHTTTVSRCIMMIRTTSLIALSLAALTSAHCSDPRGSRSGWTFNFYKGNDCINISMNYPGATHFPNKGTRCWMVLPKNIKSGAYYGEYPMKAYSNVECAGTPIFESSHHHGLRSNYYYFLQSKEFDTSLRSFSIGSKS